MILDLNRRIFSEDPEARFLAKKVANRKKGLLASLYYRYIDLDYTLDEVAEYYRIKTGHAIARQVVRLWMIHIRIYNRAQEAKDLGIKQVGSQWFGDDAKRVEYEYTHSDYFRHVRRKP